VVRVARQPILDRSTRVVGYELLFRAPGASAANAPDDREATSAVILDGLLDVGPLELVGEKLAYVNVSRDFLLSVRPLPLSPRRVVLELLEDQTVDAPLLEVLGELRADGFKIALDDFRRTPETERLLPYASVIKLDVLEHYGERLVELIGFLRKYCPTAMLLAEKVESREDFERCRDLGFEAFQGYFFARPARVRGERLPTHSLSALSAMAELEATEDFEELQRIIARDAGLSMRLLRYANSAYVALPKRVGSVHEGLTWLGAETVRRFALMVALSGAMDVPNELLVTALVRARMCEMLAGGDAAGGESSFTVGLFSVADALANAPMREVVEQLPFREDIAEALLSGTGELGELLRGVVAYQRGDFDGAAKLIRRHPAIERVYRDAVMWADANIAQLG
jgi:EAL and modified HD-GYP domain-containing signal transduction protein